MSLDVYLNMEIDTGGEEPHGIRLFSKNMTHNLGEMAEEAGIYKHLWRPEEIDIDTARQLIEPLEKGLGILQEEPERFKKLNPPNGWGTYDYLVEFVTEYLAACREHPKATVHTWT